MSQHHPSAGLRRAARSISALFAASALISAQGCGRGPDIDREGDVAAARQALTTCVTIQRGTFGSVEDATIANGVTFPGWSASTLNVGGQAEALIRFDLSAIPAGVVVSSATLSLTTTSIVSGAPLWARYATAPWSEATVTFASFNQQASNKVSGSMTPTALNTVQTMSLKTSTVQGWVDGTLPNYGLLLETMITQPPAFKQTLFVSSESPTVALRPSLQVCYMTPDDHCTPSPCQNGGTCVNDFNGYTCTCPPGYTGVDCQINIDDCAGNPCQNGGACADGINGYTCNCAPGFTGAQCQTDIDDCAPNPCQNGGVCSDQVNGYSCACPPGYSGAQCQTNIDDCAGNPCQNGGACADGINGYTCNCPAGFTGAQCQINVDDCPGNACQNGSVCVDGINGYTCSCAPGFTGTFCQTNINDCVGSPCQNGGACVDGINSYTCNCAPGFSGANCQINVNDCSPNPCQNGGACVDGINSYTCSCAPGFSGANCQTNINDCSPNPCAAGETCVDGVNSHTCVCPGGLKTFYRDADGDGYGTSSNSVVACVAPGGYVTNALDCNDGNAGIRPGVAEVCNNVDDNCNGSVDEGNPGGGASCNTGQQGICAAGTLVCSGGGYVCSQNTGPQPEACNGVDDDCDGVADDNGGCRVGVHRSYSNGNSQHFYTTSAAEAACCTYFVETYNYYYLDTFQAPGTTVWYRCANGFQHFYTTDVTCELWGPGALEGGMGYIATSQLPGTTPLYRSWHPVNGDHFYTTSYGEHLNAVNALGYWDEGAPGYVWVSP